MGFGLSGKVDAPKVPAVPAVPKAPDLAGAVAGAVGGAIGAVAGVAAGATAAVGGALAAAAKAGASLVGVAGALAEVAVSFEGPSVDVAMEPHVVLDANASYGDTNFEKGPVWVRVEIPPETARTNMDSLRLFSDSGEYDRQEPIRSFKEAGQRSVDVVFEDAPMDESFSLDVIDEQGRVQAIFRRIPYGDLRKSENRI